MASPRQGLDFLLGDVHVTVASSAVFLNLVFHLPAFTDHTDMLTKKEKQQSH